MHPLPVLGKADPEISSRCNRRQSAQVQLLDGDKESFLLDDRRIAHESERTWGVDSVTIGLMRLVGKAQRFGLPGADA
jgi:hypothetical protein